MARDSRPTPWFWGVNGAGSVLGSACAVAISMTFGIGTTLTLGACCYLAILPVGVMLGAVAPAAGHPQSAVGIERVGSKGI